MTLVAITVYIQTGPDAPIDSFEVYGEVVAPGLAITPAVSGESYHGAWTLTHIASGRAVFKGLCIRCCRKIAAHPATAGVDWTRPMERVVADESAVAVARAGREAEYHCDTGWTCDEHL